MIGLALAWLGCTGSEPPDPALEAQRRAVEQWSLGEERLNGGDPEGAVQAFAAAREVLDHPLIEAWQASAEVAAGRLEAGTRRMGSVLARDPGLAAARYNRAVWLVQLERPDEAAAELQRALADGASTPLDVLQDPDFAAVLEHPAFGFLPQEPLTVDVVPPDPEVFLGSDLTLRLRLSGLVEEPIGVQAGALAGPLELLRVTEDRAEDGSVELAWTWRVAGAGPVGLGPFTVTAGKHEASAPSVASSAAAPPGHRPDPLPSLQLWVPSREVARLERLGGVREVGDVMMVRARPGDRLTTGPTVPHRARLELQHRGRTRDVVFVVHPVTSLAALELRAADGSVVPLALRPRPR